jgi:hypothetical protein
LLKHPFVVGAGDLALVQEAIERKKSAAAAASS